MARLSRLYAEVSGTYTTSGTAAKTVEVTVPGAKPGDFAFASLDNWSSPENEEITYSAQVSAPNTVNVTVRGDDGFPNLGTQGIKVVVIPYDAI